MLQYGYEEQTLPRSSSGNHMRPTKNNSDNTKVGEIKVLVAEIGQELLGTSVIKTGSGGVLHPKESNIFESRPLHVVNTTKTTNQNQRSPSGRIWRIIWALKILMDPELETWRHPLSKYLLFSTPDLCSRQ